MYAALFALLVTAGPADEAPTVDRQIYDVLKELNNRGADLNNAGDPVGCYRVYQGGLIVVRPLLATRPAAQKLIDDSLKNVEQLPINSRAFPLHTTITELRAILKPGVTQLPSPTPLPQNPVPSPTPATTHSPPPPSIAPPNAITPDGSKPVVPPPASFPNPDPKMPAPALPGPAAALWDKLGGETRVEKVVDAWIAASQADVKIDLTAGGAHKLDAEALTRAKRRLIGHISNLSDGTVPYIGKSLADAHAGFPVAGEPLIQFLSHLRTAMIGQGIAPGDVDELMARVEKAK